MDLEMNEVIKFKPKSKNPLIGNNESKSESASAKIKKKSTKPLSYHTLKNSREDSPSSEIYSSSVKRNRSLNLNLNERQIDSAKKIINEIKNNNNCTLNININIQTIKTIRSYSPTNTEGKQSENIVEEIFFKPNVKNDKFLPMATKIDKKFIPQQREDKEVEIIEDEEEHNNVSKIQKHSFFKGLERSNIWNKSIFVLNDDKYVEKIFKKKLVDKFLKIIIDGSSKFKEEIEELYIQNPDKYVCRPYDDHFLFNEYLENGKTLIYIACQEGRTEIVEFMLLKGLDAKKKMKTKEKESCLEVSARWGYFKIVKILLAKVNYDRSELERVAKNKETSREIKILIEDFIEKAIDSKQKCLVCSII